MSVDKQIYRKYTKYIILAVITYYVLWQVSYLFIFKAQSRQIHMLKDKINTLGYDFSEIKKYPDFIGPLSSTVSLADNTVSGFNWIGEYPDPNLALFEYLSTVAGQNGVEVVDMKINDPQDKKYFSWDIKFKGSFQDILKMINALESGQRYVKIEKMEIVSSDEQTSSGKRSLFNFTILCIKKLG